MSRIALPRLRAHASARANVRDLQQAQALRNGGRYQESTQIVERVLRRDPDNPRAHWLRDQLVVAPDIDRAKAMADGDRLDEARDVLLDLAVRVPDEPEVHLRLAPIFVVQNNFAAAATHAARAAELAPGDPNVLFRAACDARWGDSAAARSYLDRAKAILADDYRGMAFAFAKDVPHLEGVLANIEGKQGLSLAKFEEAFRLQPHAISVADDLADAYVNCGRAKDALDVVDEGLRHRPEDERLHRIKRSIERGTRQQWEFVVDSTLRRAASPQLVVGKVARGPLLKVGDAYMVVGKRQVGRIKGLWNSEDRQMTLAVEGALPEAGDVLRYHEPASTGSPLPSSINYRHA